MAVTLESGHRAPTSPGSSINGVLLAHVSIEHLPRNAPVAAHTPAHPALTEPASDLLGAAVPRRHASSNFPRVLRAYCYAQHLPPLRPFEAS